LLDHLEGLSDQERRRLRDLPLRDVIRSLGLERVRRNVAALRLPPDLVPVYEALDLIQRDVLMSLPDSADRIAFLRSLLEPR
jgi:O-succinylbenzoate synthase